MCAKTRKSQSICDTRRTCTSKQRYGVRDGKFYHAKMYHGFSHIHESGCVVTHVVVHVDLLDHLGEPEQAEDLHLDE